MAKRPWLAGALLILPGMLLGISGYTFYYAKGYSYLQNDPKACVNCHVMNDQYKAWSVSPHRHVTCNECHTPHDVIGKYATKVEHGMRHSYVFTFEKPQVIRLKESGKEIVENNCVRCHEMMVSAIWHGDDGAGTRKCFECHRGVAH
jgi:cytochrome c nitrite reductase small subunit